MITITIILVKMCNKLQLC